MHKGIVTLVYDATELPKRMNLSIEGTAAHGIALMCQQ